MAASLDDLLNIDRVVAAGQFAADEKVVDSGANMDMSPELAAMTVQFCASVTMIFAFAQLSQMNWVPLQGWM